jgi:chromosome segregation ATPase
MQERYSDDSRDGETAAPNVTRLQNDLLAIENWRAAAESTAADIDMTVINSSIEILANECASDGQVKDTIESLTICVNAVMAQLSILQERADSIEQEKWDIQHEKDLMIARYGHYSGSHASADEKLERLDEMASLVLADSDMCLVKLAEYESAIESLGTRMRKVAVVLGELARAMTETQKLANDVYDMPKVPLPGQLQDIETTQNDTSLQLPDGVLDPFGPPTSVSIEIPLVYEEPSQSEPELEHEQPVVDLLKRALSKSMKSSAHNPNKRTKKKFRV